MATKSEFWSSAITIDTHLLDPDVDRSMAEFKECRVECSWILIGIPGGGGLDLKSVQASQNISCSNITTYMIASLLGGGLEPHFRVLFSAIFQGFTRENFHQGRNLWNLAEAKVWQIVVNLRTKYLCVLTHFHGM